MSKLILLALNEFNAGFFASAAEMAELPNIRQLLSMQHSLTWTDDEVERKDLDPWVQWVSIHTGSPSTVHGIRHLGDVPNLDSPQLWELLSRQGISSGIWGAMNASRSGSELCRFFLPDPWTYSERAHPEELNELLALPRYYSRNYLEVDKSDLASGLGKILLFMLKNPSISLQLLGFVPFALKGVYKFGIRNHVLFSLFDLVNTSAFLRYKKRYNPDFSLLFLNSIAHMQHHIWCEEGTLDEACRYTLEAIDRALGMLFAAVGPDESLVVMNALNQKNIRGEKEDILYRQINPARFLQDVGIRHLSVEQMMTNDAHILFASAEDAQEARERLATATINGTPVFDIEYGRSTPDKLFFQLEFWNALPEDAELIMEGRSYRFFDHFEVVVRRTGEHLQSGDAYSSGLDLPERLYNHQIQHHILRYFGIDAAAANEAAVTPPPDIGGIQSQAGDSK